MLTKHLILKVDAHCIVLLCFGNTFIMETFFLLVFDVCYTNRILNLPDLKATRQENF